MPMIKLGEGSLREIGLDTQMEGSLRGMEGSRRGMQGSRRGMGGPWRGIES
jgi:hypothetical protein